MLWLLGFSGLKAQEMSLPFRHYGVDEGFLATFKKIDVILKDQQSRVWYLLYFSCVRVFCEAILRILLASDLTSCSVVALAVVSVIIAQRLSNCSLPPTRLCFLVVLSCAEKARNWKPHCYRFLAKTYRFLVACARSLIGSVAHFWFTILLKYAKSES